MLSFSESFQPSCNKDEDVSLNKDLYEEITSAPVMGIY